MKHQHYNQHHRDDHRRLLIFFALTVVVMLFTYFFLLKPQADKARQQQGMVTAEQKKNAPLGAAAAQDQQLKEVGEALNRTAKIDIDAPQLSGSVATTGLRFDDLELKSYYTSLEQKERVRLLAPSDTKKSYFVEIGLLSSDEKIAAPTNKTQWKVVSGDKLTPTTPVTLEWDNGQGVVFTRVVSMDENYLVTVTQNITNNTKEKLSFYPYGLVSQAHHIPAKGEKITFEDEPSSVQHIGPIGYLNGELQEEAYKDVQKAKTFEYKDTTGWVGITSKYWLVALLPQGKDVFDARMTHQVGDLKQDIYQTDLREKELVVEPGQTAKNELRFFAGAKKLSVLHNYEQKLNIDRFDLVVDFGRLYFLTKPLYYTLSFLGNFFHETFKTPISFGFALLAITILLRLLTFPLQNKSYRSMNRMKDLAPKMHALKEQYGEDKAGFQKATLELYKSEKINPASGCLPILIQIPIFFALYKVIYITLDMRHAPFLGWIHDLAAPDPTNVFNLFGLLHFNTPLFLTIGAWPLLYGFTMWLQQRLNPQPEDPMQKQLFAMMPWMFVFIFAKLPAGLVIYYTWSNILGIFQQYTLRRMHGKQPVKTTTVAAKK
ncbi:MAG: oxaA [Alphaproteobacteria bacterium]|nr:oxaA [Alphaproteobacteria bacterium]